MHSNGSSEPVTLRLSASFFPNSYVSWAPQRPNFDGSAGEAVTTVTLVSFGPTRTPPAVLSLQSRAGTVIAECIDIQQPTNRSVLGYYTTSYKIRLTPSKAGGGPIDDVVLARLSAPVSREVEIPVGGEAGVEWKTRPTKAMFIFAGARSSPESLEVRITRSDPSAVLVDVRNHCAGWLRISPAPSAGGMPLPLPAQFVFSPLGPPPSRSFDGDVELIIRASGVPDRIVRIPVEARVIE